MKKAMLTALVLVFGYAAYSQSYSPYIAGVRLPGQVEAVSESLENQLRKNGLEVVGQYQPAKDPDRQVIIFTSNELKNAVRKIGGLKGFASALRIGITREGDQTVVSYTNPVYWGMAYFTEDFDQVAGEYDALTSKIEAVMRSLGTFVGSPFGSEKGIESDKLRKYRYMLGMARFDDTIELGKFGSHEEAVNKIESSVKAGKMDVSLVYRVSIPEKEIMLYGFELTGEKGEGKFLPVIDITEPKHTAFLPYEMLVTGNEVHMLHGRFRIALSFPDLTMGTFTKIMSTPPAIRKMLQQLVK